MFNLKTNHCNIFIPHSALYNDTDRLSELIRRGETDRRDSYGYTALHYAARKNNYDACVTLIRAGADVNACTNGGASPLHRAAMMGNAQRPSQ